MNWIMKMAEYLFLRDSGQYEGYARQLYAQINQKVPLELLHKKVETYQGLNCNFHKCAVYCKELGDVKGMFACLEKALTSGLTEKIEKIISLIDQYHHAI